MQHIVILRVSIGEVDEDIDARIDQSTVMAAQLKSVTPRNYFILFDLFLIDTPLTT